MNFNGLDNYKRIMETNWAYSMSTFPVSGLPFFLMPEYLSGVSERLGLDKETRDKLIEIANRICSDRDSLYVVWHMHCLLFSSYGNTEINASELPDFGNLWGNSNSYVFNLLMAVSGLNKAIEGNNKQGIPEDVTLHTLQDITLWCRYFKNELDVTGIDRRILGWIHQLLHGRLFRLGRLQFAMGQFRGNVRAFKEKRSGQVIVFAADGVSFSALGQCSEIDGVCNSDLWKSSFTRRMDIITGNPITPSGYALRNKTSIKMSEWEEVLAPGDSVLDVHIPGDGKMRFEDCAESFDMATDFFRAFFPEKNFRAYYCHSWFLDPQLDGLLNDSSNIVQFQRSLYLYPISSGAQESIRRIFGIKGINNATPETELQRKVSSFIKQGGLLRGGGGFILAKDLPFEYNKYRRFTHDCRTETK